MVSEKKRVFVTGDVIIDHHIYKGARPTPDSSSTLGTMQSETLGGAGLLYNMLKCVSQQTIESDERKGGFTVQFGWDIDPSPKLPANLHGYALWGPCPAGEKAKGRVWRVIRPLGYGNPAQEPFSYPPCKTTNSLDPNIIVLDDGGLGFRFSTAKQAWPRAILGQGHGDLEWVVLKMSSPVGQGDLWRAISVRDRLILIISIDDIRREEVRITRGISWEQTALGLVYELNRNPAISNLLRCRHLIISFRSEGALFVKNADSHKRTYRLFFDPENMEGEWGEKIKGHVFGSMSCLTAGLVNQLALPNDTPNIELGINSGLSAMRQLQLRGHGEVGAGKPGLPLNEVADKILKASQEYAEAMVPAPSEDETFPDSHWTIIAGDHGNKKEASKPLYGIARRVALLGTRALVNIPYARFGKLFTVDHNEIESLRIIRQLIADYEAKDSGKKPLSIAVFGPPGAGKSFSIKQIAEALLGKDVPILEFNLSQFAGIEELIGAFHQVRDKVLEGITPIVFWDEFDSKEYMWLQYLLAPMQDGQFQEGQITHPMGKCIFIFAGGTSYDLENFGPQKIDQEKYEKFKLLKGPDFTSRLSGYLNVLGPNRRQKYEKVGNSEKKEWLDDLSDICFPIRRALLLRVVLGIFGNEYLDIDRGLLSALLEIDRYQHGARSLEKIVLQMKHRIVGGIRRSDLPPTEVMSMHVDYRKFIQLSNRDLAFKASADELAPQVHEFYRQLGKEQGWEMKYDMEFSDLPEDIKEDNRAAASRIPQVLDLVGLYVVPEAGPGSDTDDEISKILKQNMELLAQAEHNGWMAYKKQNGWVYGKPRDDDKKIHDALLPYDKLDEKDKEKDRNSVRHFSEIVKQAKYKIVTTVSGTMAE